MNLIFIPALCTCVIAMPSNAGATLRNVGRRLFDPSTGELELSSSDSLLERTRRGATELDMCSYRMQNITKLARVAGEIFVSYTSKNFCANVHERKVESIPIRNNSEPWLRYQQQRNQLIINKY